MPVPASPAAPLPTAVPPPPSPWGAPQGFGVGSLMSRTFSVWKRNFASFSGVALLVQAPVLAGGLALGVPKPGAGFEPARAAMGLLGALLGLVVTGALTYGVIQSLGGRPARIGEMLKVGLSNSWRIFVVSFGVGVFTLLGALLLIIPAFVVISALWVAVPAAVAEPGSHESALKRSRELTKGNRLPIFLVLALFWVVVMAVGGAIGFAGVVLTGGGAGPGGAVFALISDAFGIVVGGLAATAPAVAYHDLRVLKEGASTEQLAAVFE